MYKLDAKHYGRLLYGLRRARGYSNAKIFGAALTIAGAKTPERSVWAIERGDQDPGYARHRIIEKLLDPPAGFFDDCLVFVEDEPQDGAQGSTDD